MNRKTFAAVLIPLLVCLAGPAAGQDKWPSKVVRIVVPFPPGASTDQLARQVGRDLSDRIGQPVVIENRPGASGTVGSEYVSKQSADGHTLLLATASSLAVASSVLALRYDPIKDFTPLTLIATMPAVLAVRPSLPVTSLQELARVAKREPGKLTFASNGQGAYNHLGMELLSSAAGISIRHVPYKGGAPALADLLGGHLDMLLDVVMTMQPHIKSGKLRGIATAARERSALLPDVPTATEAGYPKFEVTSWFGLLAPPNMPAGVSAQVSNELIQTLRTQKMEVYLREQGMDRRATPPAEFAQWIRDEIVKWKAAAEAAGIKPE